MRTNTKNINAHLILCTIFLLFTLSCIEWNEKEVIITKDYVINPNWSETNNSLWVTKMHLKDSSKTIDLKDPTEPELYHGLIADTSFSFVANIKYNGEDYSERKVYFNRDNCFIWRNNPYSASGFETIGELQQSTWYLLAGLSQFSTLYYMYIDSLDSLHVFKVSTMTNY